MSNGLPALTDDDIPAGASHALRKQLYALDEITRQARIIANSHYLFLELARKQAFATAINETPAAYATRVVVGSLMRHMVVGLASMFDNDQKATNLRRVLNEVLKEENRSVIETFNARFTSAATLLENRQRLIEYRSKINRDPYKGALERISDYRRQSVAHVDLDPVFDRGRPIVRDLGLILVYSCVAVYEANLFCLGKAYDLQAIKEICQKGASAFTDIVLRGVATWRNDFP